MYIAMFQKAKSVPFLKILLVSGKSPVKSLNKLNFTFSKVCTGGTPILRSDTSVINLSAYFIITFCYLRTL